MLLEAREVRCLCEAGQSKIVRNGEKRGASKYVHDVPKSIQIQFKNKQPTLC